MRTADGHLGQIVQPNAVSLKRLHFHIEAGPGGRFTEQRWTVLEQAFENVPFLSPVIHLEVHIISPAS